MKILVLSEMTIYPEIKKICEDRGLAVDKKVVIKIEPMPDGYPPDNIQYDVVIFQSKNAVIHSERFWEDIKKQKPAVYCLGKYTCGVIKEKIGVDATHPKDESSSENLAKIINKTMQQTGNYNKKYLIFSGLGGRDIIGEMLRKNNQSVYHSNIYNRREDETIKITKNDLDEKNTNYIVVSSRFALKLFLTNTSKFIKKYKMVYVIPNKRIIDKINGITSSIIINNLNKASYYIDAILNHER